MEHSHRRRDFLRLATGGGIGLLLRGAAGSKPLRGIFPIAQSPFTAANELDLDVLAEQVRLIDRGGVHGFVWPQLASEWATLTERERFAGAEAILGAGKGLRPALVIGVQAPEVATAVRYAQHAEKLGADAIISLPPSEQADPAAVLACYKQVGQATELPLFVQAVGKMDVDQILNIHRTVPTMTYVKDEAGRPLDHIRPLREQSAGKLRFFSGGHGRTLIEEMRRGSSGSMPVAGFADLYATTWDLWHSGKRKEAMEMHARTLFLLTEVTNFGFEGFKYILELRGVFKTHGARRASGGSGRKRPTLDKAGEQSLREALEFVKPYLRA
ncbi:MAG: dihydrodipicolinate synthase family protein [bacterium]|nr:dihydrodipicolinate synthase family protein [bacterium]